MRIRKLIFQGDSLSPLHFMLALIPMSLVLREVKAGYHLENQWGKVNQLLFNANLQLYGQNRTPLSQGDADRLYIPRNNGGKGIICVEDCVAIEKENL